MTQSPLHQITDDGTADGLADDETRTRRGSTLPRCVRVRITAGEAAAIVHDKKWATGPASSAYRGGKVLAPPQPMLGRQHVMDLEVRLLRQTGWRDPCCGGTRESRGRHGYAYAAGSRGSSRGGGCSAGRCACSLGGSRNESGGGGTSPGCHRAPTSSSQYARVHRFTITDQMSVILAHRRQAAAAIDNSTWLRYARLRHPVKPVDGALTTPTPRVRGQGNARRHHMAHLYTPCGQRLEPHTPA